MQEEVTQKTIALSMKTGKLTAQALQAALKKYLQHRAKGPKLHHGKQSLKQLKAHGASLTNIEVTEANIGDQPQAVAELVKGFQEGNQFETLLGVTGSGKTFTMANVIQALNKPTLIIAHNKTLAAQLYSEFKEFFPNNAVEYFVSYYEKQTKPLLIDYDW